MTFNWPAAVVLALAAGLLSVSTARLLCPADRDNRWRYECAQHRPLVECDRDLAALKAHK